MALVTYAITARNRPEHATNFRQSFVYLHALDEITTSYVPHPLSFREDFFSEPAVSCS